MGGAGGAHPPPPRPQKHEKEAYEAMATDCLPDTFFFASDVNIII